MRQFFFSVTFLCSVTLAVLSSSAQTASYSRVQEFSSIQASHADVFSAVKRIRAFVEIANSGNDKEYEEEVLYLSDGSSTMQLNSGFSKENLSDAPRPSYKVRYTYRSPRSPISEVKIDLSDYTREVSVEGVSREQVDALSGLVGGEIQSWEKGFGGGLFRNIAGIVLYFISVAMVAVSASLPRTVFPRKVKLFLIVLWFVTPILVLIIPWWQVWFPGVYVTLGDPSFFVRYNAETTFVGTVVAVLGILVPGIRYALRSHSDSDTNEDASS